MICIPIYQVYIIVNCYCGATIPCNRVDIDLETRALSIDRSLLLLVAGSTRRYRDHSSVYTLFALRAYINLNVLIVGRFLDWSTSDLLWDRDRDRVSV